MELNPRSQLTQPQWHAPQPTRFTRFMRTCILWQLVRFAVINLKMMRIIAMSHGKH